MPNELTSPKGGVKAKKAIKVIGAFFTSLTGFACILILVMIAIIMVNIVINGLPGLSWGFISDKPRDGMTRGGIFPAIFGTVAMVMLMTIMVVPLGVATAVYLHEYARQDSRLVRMVRLAVQNLAGVPSIVYGLFGLTFFVYFVGSGIDDLVSGGQLIYAKPSIIWAALTMALLTLPTVVVATEEALRAVPQSYREAAYALGATRWQVIRHVVLPQSIGGILTGGILAVSRGTGEVAPIMFTGAALYLPNLPSMLNDKFMHLGFHIYALTNQSPDVEATKPILYSSVLVLLLLTLALNIIAVFIRSKIRRKLRSI